MDRDMCNSWAHYMGMCGQAFTNPQGNVWANTSTGVGLVRASPQGQLQGIFENCKYSGTVEGIFVVNTQVGMRGRYL